jgi:hypothetical protein
MILIIGGIFLASSVLAWATVLAGPQPGASSWYTISSNKSRCVETELPAEQSETDGIYLKARRENFREWTGTVYKTRVILEPADSDIIIARTYYRDIEKCKEEQITERWWWTNLEATLVLGATIEDLCVPIDGLPDDVEPFDLGEFKLADFEDEAGNQITAANAKTECVSQMTPFLDIPIE